LGAKALEAFQNSQFERFSLWSDRLLMPGLAIVSPGGLSMAHDRPEKSARGPRRWLW
jgi:hypothetical protein